MVFVCAMYVYIYFSCALFSLTSGIGVACGGPIIYKSLVIEMVRVTDQLKVEFR